VCFASKFELLNKKQIEAIKNSGKKKKKKGAEPQLEADEAMMIETSIDK
jgi:hypothetical protein